MKKQPIKLFFKKKSSTSKVIAAKKTILAFIHMNGRRPSIHAPRVGERKLADRMRNYINPANSSYDSVFAKEINQAVQYKTVKHQVNVEQSIREIAKFVKEKGRRPTFREGQNLPLENKLGQRLVYLGRLQRPSVTAAQHAVIRILQMVPSYAELERLERVRSGFNLEASLNDFIDKAKRETN